MLKKRNKIVIGIIGGIASGKSVVAKLFKRTGKNTAIINADKIGHELLDLPPVKEKLVSFYGKEILTGSNHVDRRYLGEICFGNQTYIRKLNEIIHPPIRAEIRKKIRKIKKGLIILDAALLLEGQLNKDCDYLVFVDVPYKERLKRAIKERNWAEDELRKRESYQFPVSVKKRAAYFVIYNKDLKNTKEQIIEIIKMIQKGD